MYTYVKKPARARITRYDPTATPPSMLTAMDITPATRDRFIMPTAANMSSSPMAKMRSPTSNACEGGNSSTFAKYVKNGWSVFVSE